MKKIRVSQPKEWTKFIINEAKYYLPDECSGGIVVDCGCNVGDFVINYKNRFEKYICYDVLEENLKIFEQNLIDYEVNVDCVLEKKACHNVMNTKVPVYAHQQDKNGLDFFGNSGNVSTKLYNNNDWGWFKENQIDIVDSITIEDICEKYQTIKLLKFDIEGAEYDFLLGKDLTKFEYICGEIHHDFEIQKPLIDYICKTHTLIHNTSHTFTFKIK